MQLKFYCNLYGRDSYIRTDRHKCPHVHDIVESDAVKEKIQFRKNWAGQPPQGKRLGKNSSLLYMSEIMGWFLTGMDNKGKQLVFH